MTNERRGAPGRRALMLLAAVVAALLAFSGMAVAATVVCQDGAMCLGTSGPDTLLGTEGPNYDMYAGRGSDTLKGFGDVDYLHGQTGADKLLGGTGNDSLIGGAGDDTLRGGEGSDGYVFADGWGKDTIIDTAAPTTQLSFFNIQAQAPDTEAVIVDLRSGSGPEAKDASGTNTINWDGKVIDTVFGGDGDDQITGNDEHNLLSGHGGADTIYGGAGGDTIHVEDGSLSDTVHCGPGTDWVYYDVEPVTAVSDVISSDCEYPHPENL